MQTELQAGAGRRLILAGSFFYYFKLTDFRNKIKTRDGMSRVFYQAFLTDS